MMLRAIPVTLGIGTAALVVAAAPNPVQGQFRDRDDDYWEDYRDDYEDHLEDLEDAREDYWEERFDRRRAYRPYRLRGRFVRPYRSRYYGWRPGYDRGYRPFYGRPYYGDYGYGYYRPPASFGRIGPFLWEVW